MVEMTVVIVLLGLVGALVATMIVRGFQSYKFSQETISMQEEAAKCMRDFEKIARGSTEVVTSEPGEYEFYAYLLNDAQPAPSKIRYFTEDGSLKRGVIQPSGAGPVFDYPAANENISGLCDYVTNGDTIFTYYNDSNAEISEPVPKDAVRMVEFSISLDKNTSKPPEAVSQTTKVNLRNLKTNL